MDDALYDDGSLALFDEEMVIRRYYFPSFRAKRIAYAAVRKVTARPMTLLTGKARGWGTSHPGYWLPLDLGRWRRHTLLVVDVGRRVKPCVTPVDPKRALQLLSRRVPID